MHTSTSMSDCTPAGAAAATAAPMGESALAVLLAVASGATVAASVGPAASASASAMAMDSSLDSLPPSAIPAVAGPLARALSIPSATASAAQGDSDSARKPSKKSKHSPGGSPAIAPMYAPHAQQHGQSAMDVMRSASQPAASASAAAPSSVGQMSPGTYYRQSSLSLHTPSHGAVTAHPHPPVTSSGASSVQKRRSSSSSSSLSSSPPPPLGSGMVGNHVTSAAQVGAAPSAVAASAALGGARKPPAYPAGPGTPGLHGRSGPVHVGGQGLSSSVGRSSPMHSPMTAPGTPQQLPMPRSMLPNSPLTPALAPERTISLSTASGKVTTVSAQQVVEHMMLDGKEAVLPPQAADKPERKTKSRTAHVAPPSPSIPAGQPIVTPVKHLVKLSSLSSLSSLITPASTAGGSPGSSPGSASSQPGGRKLSPGLSPSAAPVGSPDGSPQSAHSASASPRSVADKCCHAAPAYVPHCALPPTYIILDIDETVHVNAYSPCIMMCEKGLEMYQRIISSHPNYRNVSYASKSALTKQLQSALQSKRTVEESTGELLNALQASSQPGAGGTSPSNNIVLFGLTARFSHMANTTRKELVKLEIDLEKSSPFPWSVRKRAAMAAAAAGGGGMANGSPTKDRSLTPSPTMAPAASPTGGSLGSSPSMSALSLPPSSSAASEHQREYYPDLVWVDASAHGTDARYERGVIYTNACEKGPVLARFLEFLWKKIEEDNVLSSLENEEHRRTHDAVHHSPSSEQEAALGAAGGGDRGSLMSLARNPSTHAKSAPIAIGGSPLAAASAHSPMASSPSPTESTMSMLAAAGKAANGRASIVGIGKPRRDSKSTDHLVLPMHQSHEPQTPMSPLSQSAAVLHPPTQLPSRIIFIDDRLQNCFSVYESLSSHTLFDRFYNRPGVRRGAHVPTLLEAYCCHYSPHEATGGATNQTKADAAATAEQPPDLELIETQIHHFLCHAEILNDAKGMKVLQQIRMDERTAQQREMDERAERRPRVHVAAEQQQTPAAAAAPAPTVAAAAAADTSMHHADEHHAMEEDDASPTAAAVSSTPVAAAAAPADADEIMASTPRQLQQQRDRIVTVQ